MILDVMENNTVYAVEESEKGMTLSHYLHLRSRTLTPAEARTRCCSPSWRVWPCCTSRG